VYHKKPIIIIIIIIITNGFMPGGNVLQCKTGNTVYYTTLHYTTLNTIKHIIQNNIQHSRQPSINKIRRINQWHGLCVCGPNNVMGRILLKVTSDK
jgi:hypothetical protein